MDRAYANRVLATDPEFQSLWKRFNTLGIVRFLLYIGAVILAIVAGINAAWGLLIFGLTGTFVLIMIVNYNRMTTRARQQGRAVRLGLISEDDLR